MMNINWLHLRSMDTRNACRSINGLITSTTILFAMGRIGSSGVATSPIKILGNSLHFLAMFLPWILTEDTTLSRIIDWTMNTILSELS